jgi:hypothetical protein
MLRFKLLLCMKRNYVMIYIYAYKCDENEALLSIENGRNPYMLCELRTSATEHSNAQRESFCSCSPVGTEADRQV